MSRECLNEGEWTEQGTSVAVSARILTNEERQQPAAEPQVLHSPGTSSDVGSILLLQRRQ